MSRKSHCTAEVHRYILAVSALTRFQGLRIDNTQHLVMAPRLQHGLQHMLVRRPS